MLTFLGFVAVSALSLQGYASNKGYNGGGIYGSRNNFSLNTNTVVLFAFVLAVAFVTSWIYFTMARAFTKQFICKFEQDSLQDWTSVGAAAYYCLT